jgi:hypothetical protein
VVAHITTSDVQTWLETTKLTISTIEPTLEADVSAEVLARLATQYGAYTPLWVDSTTTPQIVKQIIAMLYAGWIYDRAYSEVETNEALTSYGAVLRSWAMTLINDILGGSVPIAEIGSSPIAEAPVYYPNDASSTTDAWQANTDEDDNSLGPAKFGMGKVF